MQLNLSPSTEAFLASVVSSGAYRDPSEAIEEGVDLLRARLELKQRLANSKAQLDRGEGIFLDDAGLANFFEDLKSQVRTKAGS